jgi:hypothetical protein
MKTIKHFFIVLLTLPLFIIFDIRAVIANRFLTSEDCLKLYLEFLKWTSNGIRGSIILPAIMVFLSEGHLFPICVGIFLFLIFAILAVCEFFNPKFLD